MLDTLLGNSIDGYRDTADIARELLGYELILETSNGDVGGVVVETEAYLGLKDKACHSYGGKKTKRVETLYLEAGHSYVYLIYGMYHCLNLVTGGIEQPEAVLIRAIEPTVGVEVMKKNRSKKKLKELTSGPGKLCQALGVNLDINAQLFNRSKIKLIPPSSAYDSSEVVETVRVGIDYAGEAASWPLRFFLNRSEYVSKR